MDLKDLMDQRSERKSRRESLLSIRNAVDKHDYLSIKDLAELQIQRFPMSLSREDDKPLFFTPYEASVEIPDAVINRYPELDDELGSCDLIWYLNLVFEDCELPERDRHPPGTYYADYGDYKCGNLLNTWRRPHWKVWSAWHMLRPKRPHMKVSINSEITPDPNFLFRGELHAIIDVMCARLNVKSLRPYIIAPVLLYSQIGPYHLRIIEAFFNGKKLIVHVTKHYDMTEKDDELLVELTRWWLGHSSKLSTQIDEKIQLP